MATGKRGRNGNMFNGVSWLVTFFGVITFCIIFFETHLNLFCKYDPPTRKFYVRILFFTFLKKKMQNNKLGILLIKA